MRRSAAVGIFKKRGSREGDTGGGEGYEEKGAVH